MLTAFVYICAQRGITKRYEKDTLGTLIETASLRHALDDTFPEDKHFFSLVNYESHLKDESLLALFVVNEESLEPLKQCIRDHTDNFRKIKGGMFSRSISDYEGTF